MCAAKDEESLLRNLWKAVIDQALQDYRWEPADMTNKSLYRLKFNAKQIAGWWLKSEDFYEVCQLAGLKADEVLQQFNGDR